MDFGYFCPQAIFSSYIQPVEIKLNWLDHAFFDLLLWESKRYKAMVSIISC